MLLLFSIAAAAQEANEIHLVPWPQSVAPEPQSVALGDGAFELYDPVRIVVASSEERVEEIATFLGDIVWERSGFDVRVLKDDEFRDPEFGWPGTILLANDLEHPNPEAYSLEVSRAGIVIDGATPEGLLWGVQTLRQLLPPEFEDTDGERREVWTIPPVDIDDAPRFGWRGSLMDVSRHFFPVDFVKRYIDLLSRYKMNVLHWHLTEDQGWRLEIEQYPRLTEVAAWRTEPDGSRHGGFYTQDEVREVVEYARLRGVRVVPEIEMPGHSTAALVAYPELGCAEPPDEVPNYWGVFPDIYCAGKEETFTFLENVLDEVTALFPSEYIHIGGDEVPKERWEECEPCQALMQREGIPDEDALQAWFIQRIGRYLDNKGKTLIGWDEILEGGGVPGSVVQVWRDPATIREAIQQGHDVVASPTSHAYFDYSPAALPLEQVYSFDPTTDLAPDEHAGVLGGEGNLWSEYITTANFDLQAFPRILALAEVLWSQGDRDFGDFKARLDTGQYARLQAMGVRPGPEDSDVVRLRVGTDSLSSEPRATVESSVEGIEVRYTTDRSTPTTNSELLTDTTTFADGDQVELGVFVDGEPMPIQRGFSVIDHLARGKTVTLEHSPDVRYPGPSLEALTDGLHGSDNHRDGIWQGWWDEDLGATIDLGSVQTIQSVSLSFINNEGAWILPSESLAAFVSEDGDAWVEDDGIQLTEYPGGTEAKRVNVFLTFQNEEHHPEARFIRLEAVRAPLPEGHPGAGHPGWLFADEIVVR